MSRRERLERRIFRLEQRRKRLEDKIRYLRMCVGDERRIEYLRDKR